MNCTISVCVEKLSIFFVRLSTYFSIYTRTAQLILDNHNNNSKHPHNEGVVADTLSLFKKGFSSAESVADIWFLFAIFIIRDTFINATS